MCSEIYDFMPRRAELYEQFSLQTKPTVIRGDSHAHGSPPPVDSQLDSLSWSQPSCGIAGDDHSQSDTASLLRFASPGN